ncbi:5-oxoprolinase/urea amidolyase family protein [Faecalispora jeddahensis]|uniref:5-oxoprolinase/urea amidolyase family protein n=1 Tax=Faecalispora jeddahensis TaxID=1414721 RepID=UPI00145B262E|nr:5-oxoprolinase/urea amidolyase family protein [Faecalispora jeddahensis]
MNSAVVLSPGLFTTVQDAGRFGFLESGISPAGVMDDFSFRAANLLVGNEPGEAVLEGTLIGPSLRFQGSCLIAATGGEAEMKINGNAVPMWQSVPVKDGDVLSFAPMRRGCRLYIAFAGGIAVPDVLGSKSTCCKAKIGGLQGRTLCTGDELPLSGSVNAAALAVCEELVPDFPVQISLRVVLGPQENAFTPEGIRTFLSGEYAVTPVSDRMGYRLEGPQIEQSAGADIISDGIVMGAVQVPANGQPIIMMADRQTTGGYTKIATVITADLSLLAQARPGDTVCFHAVSVEEAQEELLAYQEKVKNIKETMLPVQGAEMQMSLKDVVRLMQEFQNSRIGVLRFSNPQGELYLEKGGPEESGPEKSGGTETTAEPQEDCCESAPGSVVTSPLVGIFYTSAAPDQPPFVQVGTAVKKGDPLFVIESMKIMNEIVSERDGVITEIMAQNEQAVEFGQPVLRMK